MVFSINQAFCHALHCSVMLGLICIDVDGTLVGMNNAVRDDVWQALAQAKALGIHLAICSGRPAMGNALAYARRLDDTGWHIFQNGASVLNVKSGESLSEEFPLTQLQELQQRALQTGHLLEWYTDQAMFVSEESDYARRHADLLGIPFEARGFEDLDGMVVRTQWVVPVAEAIELQQQPHEGLELHPAGSPAMPDVTFISVTRAGVNKGSAVRKVAEHYQVPLERVMMVGDGHNDVSALEIVGYSVAMGNAEAEAQKAAQYHVGHVDQGGLLEAIELALQG